MWTIGYVASIVIINCLFSVVPLVPIWGAMWPPVSLIVGFAFVLRDFAQREIGHWVVVAMLIGGGLSYIMADPFVAMASVAAFLISETVDWLVYSFTKRSFAERILWSSALATPVDSAVFLGIIGHLSVVGVAAMTLSKLAGAGIVYAVLRRPSPAV